MCGCVCVGGGLFDVVKLTFFKAVQYNIKSSTTSSFGWAGLICRVITPCVSVL